MTIEATLESIDSTLKLLLAAAQSGAAITAAVADATDKADEAAQGKKRGRPAKTENTAATDAAGPVYWVNDSLKQAYEQLPGNAAPQDKAFVQVTAEQFAAKKAEYAAPAASAPVGAPTWDEAVAALKSLAQHKDHGSDAVVAVIKAIDPAAQNVPHLKGRGFEAAIIAKVNERLNPPAAGGDDALFG